MNIVFAGTPEFAATALNAIVAAGFNVITVYTQPDRPSGRGMKLTPSAVKQAAARHGIAVRQPASLKSVEAQAELAALKPDVMVVAAYGLILPQAVLDIPRHGCLNIHASLLPRWRGAAPIHRAILAGDTESGVGIMQMEAGLDTGPVLLERCTPISRDDTTGSLHDRLAALGAEAIVEVLHLLARNAPPAPRAQPAEGVTYAHKISPEEARIDWAASAELIERQVRAFNPAPGAWTTWRGEPLKVWSARALTESTSAASMASTNAESSTDAASADAATPGRIIDATSERLLVRCGTGNMAIGEIQRAGGKRMSVAAWLAGAGPTANERFE
jgi:methionyl-tRNA formyltransferase